MSDPIKHECGIALIRLLKPLEFYLEKYHTALYGLNKLYILMEKQHNRGQDGAGIGGVSFDIAPGKEYMFRSRSVNSSPLPDIFSKIHNEFNKFNSAYPFSDVRAYKENLPFMGELLLGHLRYGTYGHYDIEHCHPVLRQNNWKTRNLMIAGNFNMTNNDDLFKKLVDLGQYPINQSDTITVLEKIGHFLDDENEKLYDHYKYLGYNKVEITQLICDNLSIEKVLIRAVKGFDGGYSIGGLVGHGDAFVLRDPAGIRPAYYYHDDEVVVVASEKPAIRTSFNLPFHEIKEVGPGNALIIKKDGEVREVNITEPTEKKSCSFERIYFSRGTDEDIYQERKNLGRYLADDVLRRIDYDIENTVFSYIPNTAEVAFLGLIEGVNEYMNNIKIKQIMELKTKDETEINRILSAKARVEKIAVKDVKIRTFITDDKQRNDLTAHVYDTTYGLINTGIDNLVVLDDSIVRGTTLKQSILNILDRLHPKRILIVSSAPQIRYPDCYGIDMSKLKDFVAFRAIIELLKENEKSFVLKDVYHKCREQDKLPFYEIKNNVKELYSHFTTEEITRKIIELVKPESMFSELDIIYQSVEDLHKAIPNHSGDWYFTGDFPTPGGNKVVNKAFINYYEGKDVRSY
jgi:amidophosphoribosyltransferase